MVTRKEEKKEKKKKKTSSSLRASPSAGSAAGQAAVSPSPTLSRLRPAACTGEPGTDLSTQASPTPRDQGQGQGLPCTPTPAPRAQRSDGKVSGRIWGQHGSRRPSPSRTCLARPGPRPGPHPARARDPWPVRTWPLLTPCGHGSRSRSRSRERRGETRQGVERKISAKRTPAQTRPPWGGGSRPVDASRRTPGCLGTSGQEDPPPGCGNADS